MKCIYINLDSASERRARFEANWAHNRGPDWRLERFAALDTRYVEHHAVVGILRPAEKACFLSHCASIALNLNAAEPLFVMEDDAVLGPRSAPTIDNFLKVSDNYEWDIVFTEVGIVAPSAMLELIKLRKELAGKDEVRLLDLATLPFAGATGYIINHRSLKKIGALLGARERFDIPYDLLLRQLIYEKKLKALVFFPFVSSLSNSSQSDIRVESAVDEVWTAFRQLASLDRDLDALRPAIERIGSQLCDEEARLLGILLASQVSASFTTK